MFRLRLPCSQGSTTALRKISETRDGCRSGGAPGKPDRVPSFASIAAKQAASPEMIASFLLLPHATMPAFPLTRKDVQDLAAFIMSAKK